MQSMPIVEAQQFFDDLLVSVQDHPVAITEYGNTVAVIISDAEYKTLKESCNNVISSRAKT